MTLAFYIAFGALLLALGILAVVGISFCYVMLFGLTWRDIKRAPVFDQIHLPRYFWRHLIAFVVTAMVCAFIGCFAETIVQLVR